MKTYIDFDSLVQKDGEYAVYYFIGKHSNDKSVDLSFAAEEYETYVTKENFIDWVTKCEKDDSLSISVTEDESYVTVMVTEPKRFHNKKHFVQNYMGVSFYKK